MKRLAWIWRTLASGGVVAVASMAWADQSELEALQKRVDELSREVQQLRQQQSGNARDVALTIDSVLRDAERRSQLLANSSDTAAGYNDGFYIRSGDFLLRPRLVYKPRFVADYREDTSGPKADETEAGFEVRSMRLIFQGTAVSPDLNYYFRWDSRAESTRSDVKDASGAVVGSVDNANGGQLYLRDAWVSYRVAGGFGLRGGQFKDPVSHEQLLNDDNLVAVERSMADAIFGTGYTDRVQGVTLVYGGYDDSNPLHAELALTDGLRSLNTGFGKTSFDFGLAGRVEWKLAGTWKGYADLTGKSNTEDVLVLGGGSDWSQAGDGDSVLGTVDAQWNSAGGVGLYGAMFVRHLNEALTATGQDQTDWGALGQASWLFDPAWLVFGRYSFVEFDDPVSRAGGRSQFHEISVGFDHFLGGHGSAGRHAKITVDLNWLPHGAPASLSAQDYLGDSNGQGEVVLRGQFQLSL